MTERRIEIPYVPRPLWRDVIHPALDRVRFATLVCHRRFGKTVGTLNHCIRKASTNTLPAPQFAYVAPFRTQAKLIAWEYLKHYTGVIPSVKVREVDLSVELPTVHAGRPGAKIIVAGADKPDNLRGMYLDGVILDEFGQMRRNFWNEVIRPALADRAGWAWVIGTPAGKNQFYERYQSDIADPARFTCLYTVDDSHIIPEPEIEDMKRDMTPTAIRQELYCDFTASQSDILITIDLVAMGRSKRYSSWDLGGAARVIGVDVARYGDDRTVIIRRQGLAAFKPKVFLKLSNMDVADAAAAEINEFRPHAVFVDAGRGEGVIDRLRQLGYGVIEANFGAAAINGARYARRREEMWDAVRKWLVSGGSLPDDEDLCEELSMPTYTFDASNRMVLEKKEKMKERIGKSPDFADALALTFFAPVAGDEVEPEYARYVRRRRRGREAVIVWDDDPAAWD
jgi:hypothetical protein